MIFNKKNLLFLFLFSVLILPEFVFANQYSSSGFGDSASNSSCWSDNGETIQGQPVYENVEGTRFVFDYPGNVYTVLDDHTWTSVEQVLYYTTGSQVFIGGWTEQDGASPAGDFTLLNYSNDPCVPDTPISTSTNATSTFATTTLQFYDNVIFGLALIIFLIGFIFWAYWYNVFIAHHD